jgi:hypothetical protein
MNVHTYCVIGAIWNKSKIDRYGRGQDDRIDLRLSFFFRKTFQLIKYLSFLIFNIYITRIEYFTGMYPSLTEVYSSTSLFETKTSFQDDSKENTYVPYREREKEHN